MKKYCSECGKEVETIIVEKNESYKVCGELIEVNAKVLICKECNEELFCEELDNETLVLAYNKYRIKHKLLLPEEIKNIRERYGLSQRSFAKLLNWGDKTINRYENGSIQDKAHNSLLLLLRDTENMKAYLNENEILLDEKKKQKLLKRIEQLEQDEDSQCDSELINRFFSKSPSIENGFKTFDYDKLCSMVIFFANKSNELLKTKLLKLLNYSDMIYYKENGISMSGSRYVHLPFGPVMENYDMLFGQMYADNIASIDITYVDGYEKHQVVAEKEISEYNLTDSELDVLQRIYNKFESYGSKQISNYSHQEKGYISTTQGEIIPYSYAKDIELD